MSYFLKEPRKKQEKEKREREREKDLTQNKGQILRVDVKDRPIIVDFKVLWKSFFFFFFLTRPSLYDLAARLH